MRQQLTNASYDSIADFLSACELPCLNALNGPRWEDFMNESHGGFYGAGCATGRDVLKTMKEGWKQGRERMEALRDKIGTPDIAVQDRRRRMTRGDHGDVLDIHSVYAGRMDIAWSRPVRRTTQAPPRVDIVANMICSGAEHADVLFWRGAAAAVLADVLEQAGYMVRLTVGFGGRTGDSDDSVASCRITVKEHGMPFDIMSTSAVILPGFFRALGHAWIQNHATAKRCMGGIYVGRCIMDESEIDVGHKVRDHGTAVAFINAIIARFNGELEQAA